MDQLIIRYISPKDASSESDLYIIQETSIHQRILSIIFQKLCEVVIDIIYST